MARFEDLPLDLLPQILVHLLKPDHLASLCLVNRTFYSFSVPKLYRRIVMFPGYKPAKTRVVKLFTTLAACPNLACHVRQLDIRDFPKFLGVCFPDEQLMSPFTKGLENCVHLKACSWSRYGSLTSHILTSLARCPELTDFTLNGGPSPFYEPKDLVQLHRLRKISLIMLSSTVFYILPRWLQAIGQSLTSLSLICQDNSSVTDSSLRNISQYLSQLEHFSLAGCQGVTNEGVWSIIRHNVRNIKELSLENISPQFDVLTLGGACSKAGGLSSLRSFTSIMFWEPLTDAWITGTELLLKESPLEVFQSHMSDDSDEALTDTFCIRVVNQHRDHLVRFSFHRQRISLSAVEHMCISCPSLEELFLNVKSTEMAYLIPILAQATHLRIVHISPADRLLTWNARIETNTWKVERRVYTVKGIVQLERFLTAAENSDIPERILVVHE